MPRASAWILIGVFIRALLLMLSHPAELQSDESHYAWLGLSWERFGYLTDSQRFLWPPAYPFLHRLGFQFFQEDGILAVRALQVCASAATGWGVAALARRLVHERASSLAAALWALHLPLAGYCALGWPEPFFMALLLPALTLLYDGAGRAHQGRLIAAGLLFGLASLFKEIALPIAALCACWLTRDLYRRGVTGALPAALAFTLAAALPMAPWAARNLHHYGEPIPSGVTLGENLYHGWNGNDRNFDSLPVARSLPPAQRPDTSALSPFHPDEETAWPRPGGGSLLEREDAKRRAGLEWATDHPLMWLRSRVAKAAHMFAPISFPVRHIALDRYGGALNGGLPGRTLLLLATLQSAGLLVFAAAALATKAPRSAIFWIPVAALLSQPLLVGMSRLRVPLTPLLFIAVAALLTTSPTARGRMVARIAGVAAIALFFIDYRSTMWVLSQAWSSS